MLLNAKTQLIEDSKTDREQTSDKPEKQKPKQQELTLDDLKKMPEIKFI